MKEEIKKELVTELEGRLPKGAADKEFYCCRFTKTELEGAVFKNCTFHLCTLKDLQLTRVKFVNVKFSLCRINNIGVVNCNFENVEVNYRTIECLTITGGSLQHCSFKHVRLQDIRLSDVILDDISFKEVDIIRGSFKRIDVSDLVLKGIYYDSCSFYRCKGIFQLQLSYHTCILHRSSKYQNESRFRIQIGCKNMTLKHWRLYAKRKAKLHHYLPKDIKLYSQMIELAVKLYNDSLFENNEHRY